MANTSYINYDGQQLYVVNATKMSLTASTNNDYLVGGSSGTAFVSDGNVDTFVGGSGNDIFSVYNSATVINEKATGGADTVLALTNYVLPSNVQNLLIYGAAAHGITGVGNNLANLIVAESSNQTLNGMGGDDVLVGSSAGADTFVFQAGSGHDMVQNFIAGSASNADIVRIQDYGFYTFGQVEAAMTQSGSNVVLKLDANDSVTFTNTSVSAFAANNFQLGLDPSRLSLTFDDEFNSLDLDSKGGAVHNGVWSTQYGFNSYGSLASTFIGNYTGEQQIYVDPSFTGSGSTALGLNPFSLSNGVLTVTAGVTPTTDLSALWNKSYYSGLLTTKTSFSQTYGYFEMRAELPSGNGAWPAFWLLPETSNPGMELDILETAGNNPNYIKMTAHDTSYTGGTVGFGAYVANATTSFHTYGLLWTAQTITWFIDGAAVAQIATPADMNKPMYILLDEAISSGYGTVDPNNMPDGFKLDYVRAYTVAAAPVVAPTAGSQATLTAPTHTITAGNGAATLNDEGVASNLVGGSGNDTFVVTNAGDVIKAHAGAVNTVLTTLNSYVAPANVQNLTFTGTGSFTGTGNGQAVVITGGAGNDTLADGGGASTLIGGGGVDTFNVSNAATVVNEAAGGQATVYVSAGHWTATAGSAIQRVVATGVGAINLAGSSDHAMTLVANNGIDTLSDNGMADTLVGGTGMDTFVVTNAGTVVQVESGAGLDTVKTTLNNYVLPANVQNLIFTGTGNFHGVGNATTGSITGGVGNDTLESGSGKEVLNGGGGMDTFIVNNAQDTVIAAAGSHSVEFTSVSGIKAAANVVALTYTGSGAFTGYANSTGTFLTGGHGNDLLDGGAGNDTLDGGGGNDTLMAGAGADQFRFDAPGTGVDRVVGFKAGVDHIALSEAGFGLTSLSDVTFDIGASPKAVADGHAQILYNSATGALYFDASGGDGHMVQFASLDGHPTLTAASFTLV